MLSVLARERFDLLSGRGSGRAPADLALTEHGLVRLLSEAHPLDSRMCCDCHVPKNATSS